MGREPGSAVLLLARGSRVGGTNFPGMTPHGEPCQRASSPEARNCPKMLPFLHSNRNGRGMRGAPRLLLLCIESPICGPRVVQPRRD